MGILKLIVIIFGGLILIGMFSAIIKESTNQVTNPNASPSSTAPSLSQSDIQKLGSIGDACRADLASTEWKASKAGQICAKHPDWSKCDCDKLAADKLWIGMSVNMLFYLRGNPDHANVSNYGSGNQYQNCWDNYTPSCFYVDSAGLVTSYN